MWMTAWLTTSQVPIEGIIISESDVFEINIIILLKSLICVWRCSQTTGRRFVVSLAINWTLGFCARCWGFSPIKKLLGRTEMWHMRERNDSRYEQFEISPETIEPERRPWDGEQRQTDTDNCNVDLYNDSTYHEDNVARSAGQSHSSPVWHQHHRLVWTTSITRW